MPCRVDIPDEIRISQSSFDKLVARADKLQEELCRTQRLALELADILRTENYVLPQKTENAIFRTKRKWKEHREWDKKRAIKEAAGPLSKLLDQERRIVEMGGVPGQELLEKLRKAQEHVAALESSDPLTTELY